MFKFKLHITMNLTFLILVGFLQILMSYIFLKGGQSDLVVITINALGVFMMFGDYYEHPPMEPEYDPAVGWVNTIGLTGKKTLEGSIYGNIRELLRWMGGRYLGAVGFTGIRISPFSGFFYGSALRVKLSYNPL